MFDETVNETSIRGEIRGVFVDVFEELEQKRHLRVKNGVVELRDIERCVVFEGRLSMGEKVVEGGYKRGFSIRKVEMGGRRRRRVEYVVLVSKERYALWVLSNQIGIYPKKMSFHD